MQDGVLPAAWTPRSTADGAADDAIDRDLRARFCAGDTRAFDLLARRHQDALLRFVRWQLGMARQDAEDVTQDVLVEIYRALPRFEARSRLRTWMFGVARNVCLRHRRNQVTPCPSVGDNILRKLPDPHMDPLAGLAQREVQARVQSAIAGLSPTQRIVLLLREIEGLSYQEIATTLDLPIGTVRSRLHNARAALAECLAPLAPEAGEKYGV
jgi:RNA polymerase sigma-70 factor, ECF subfamily